MALVVADLFSGAGGFTAGLDSSIYRVSSAIDVDPIARTVYKTNNPDTTFLLKDIRDIKNFKAAMKRPDLLLAGPPCQGFSLVGMKTKRDLSIRRSYDPADDPRNTLPLEVVRVASQFRPGIVIMENVPAMNNHIVRLEGMEIPVVSAVTSALEESGYYVSKPFIIEASKLGIAQRRKRSFIVATTSNKILPSEVLNAQERYLRFNGEKYLSQILKDLESIPMVHNSMKMSHFFPDHIGRFPNDDDLLIIRNLKAGENYKSLLERMPEVVEKRKHKTYSIKSFADKFFRLRWTAPSRTIVAHLQKDGNSFIHPSLDRSISVREAARIQSFPDSFLFGVRMSPAYRLIGNAVPPVMGKFLVETISRITGMLNEERSSFMQFAGLIS